jgi:hypothetical protein
MYRLLDNLLPPVRSEQFDHGEGDVAANVSPLPDPNPTPGKQSPACVNSHRIRVTTNMKKSETPTRPLQRRSSVTKTCWSRKSFYWGGLKSGSSLRSALRGITGIQALAVTSRSISRTAGLNPSMQPNLILRARSKYLWRIDEAAAPEGFV